MASFHNYSGTTRSQWQVGKNGPLLLKDGTDLLRLRNSDDSDRASLELAGLASRVRSVSSTGPINEDDFLVLASASAGAVVLTLPVASNAPGAIIVVRRTDSSANGLTINPNGTDTIDGGASLSLEDEADTFWLQSDGVSDWVTISEPGLPALSEYNTLIGDADDVPFEVPFLSGRPSDAKLLTVSQASGLADYDSIGAAITAASALSPSSTNPVAILVYPGVYTESAFTVPSWVTLESAAGLRATEIVASSTTQQTVTLSPNSRLTGFTVTGSSGAGGVGILVNGGLGGPAVVNTVAVADCETGMRVTGANTLCLAQSILVTRATGETMDTGVFVDNGGSLDASTIFQVGLPVAIIDDAVRVDDANSSLTVGTLSVEYANEGLVCDDDCEVVLQGGLLKNIQTNGVRLGATNNPTVNIGSLTIESGATRDIKCDGTNGTLTGAGAAFDHSNSDLCFDTNLLARTTFAGDRASISVGDFGVGLHDDAASTFVGSGPHYIEGMAVFTDDGTGTSFVDETADAVSQSGSTFTAFQGTGAGNVFYVGGDEQFYGIWHNIQTAIALGTGAIICEWWNGSAWTEALVMASDAARAIGGIARDQYANAIFERGSTLENIRFGGIDSTSWTQNSVNGTTKYWVRFRVTSAITTSPTFEQIRLHGNSSVFNDDGTLEFFGTARQRVLIPGTKFPLFDIGGFVFTSPSEDINISSNITLLAIGNEFRDANVDIFASAIHIPPGICTSCPLTFEIQFAPIGTATGDVEFTLIYLQKQRLEEGDVLTGTLTEATKTEIVTIASPGVNDELKAIVEFEIDMDNVLPNNLIPFAIGRDATAGNANDTLAGAVYLVDIQVFGVAWRIV